MQIPLDACEIGPHPACAGAGATEAAMSDQTPQGDDEYGDDAVGVSRRGFLTGIGVAGVVGIAVGGGIGYATAPKSSGSASGGGSTTGPTGEPSVSPSTSSETIKVGLVAPVTGPYSGDGQEMQRGAELGVEAVNKAGGVHGRQLELVIADVSDLSPELYVKAAQRLTGEVGAAAVFSGYCSNDSAEFATYAQSGVPMFHYNTLQANVDYVKSLVFRALQSWWRSESRNATKSNADDS